MADLVAASHLLKEGFARLRAAAESASTTDDELLSILTLMEGAVAPVGSGRRRRDRGVAAARRVRRGYRKTTGALGDLLGWEGFEARRRVVAAEQVCERIGLDGAVVPARLPATGKVFTAGQATLRHVETIAGLLGSAAAGRLSEAQRAGVEEQLAGKAGEYTPAQLRTWGMKLIELLDQDGAEPDDHRRDPVNELVLRRHRDGSGGTVSGRFDDAAMFDATAALIDAKAKPLDKDDRRGLGRRQAEALADACAWILNHGDHAAVPDTGGRRTQLNVHIDLTDLENRARAAMLDFGGRLSPESLRMLACDAAVIPLVLNGAGQPLDVGRATRTIPDGLRRAVTARDRGCAHPGCDRQPSWAEIHHIREWEHGGHTTLDNLAMLCRVHHRLIHHSQWIVRIRDGLPEFLPPRWVDPEQRPRRNPQHDLPVSG